MSFGNGSDKNKGALGVDRVYLRLGVIGVLIVTCFVALFSRLWFLQVLAADNYRLLAKENRVRLVHTEPPRGRILDRHGVVLVKNRASIAVTVDRQVVNTPRKRQRTLKRLAMILRLKLKDLRARLNDATVSPYKPVAVANDVSEKQATYILEHKDKLPGVDVLPLPVRRFPQGQLAAHILGYVNEISKEQLASDHFRGVKPPYAAGDLVGQSGIEYSYDRYLRGRPGIEKVVVNASGEVVGKKRIAGEHPGNDLILSLDARIQKLTETSLYKGILAARAAHFQAPAGGVVVMDPSNGQVLGMASYPTFDPSILADGITQKEFNQLGQATPSNPDDDALLNRTIQAGVPPGSTFKVVTAGAAMETGVATPYTTLDCPGSVVYPPQGGPGSVTYPNWTPASFGYMGFARSLEVSCDTFYYQLGWDMEQRWGAANGDGTERFQRYLRLAGFGHDTGVDLPNEFPGRVPDNKWCEAVNRQTNGALCPYGWLPGYTINMAIGQGDLLVSPLQMAVTYAALANGGKIVQPQLGMALARTNKDGNEATVHDFKPHIVRQLPLDSAELSVIRQGLVDVVSGAEGTATAAFAGFPTARYPIAGKTGTAQIGESQDLNRAWFLSYAPADNPKYVVAVYLEKAGHGGESAAPIARQIYEGLFHIDTRTAVSLGQDASG